MDKNLKKLCKSAGIERQISFHKGRHTAATHMTALGVPLNVVKDRMGHSQIAGTANLYRHAVPAGLQAARTPSKGPMVRVELTPDKPRDPLSKRGGDNYLSRQGAFQPIWT